MALRAGLALQYIYSSSSIHRPDLRAGCLITEGARGEGGFLIQWRGRSLMER